MEDSVTKSADALARSRLSQKRYAHTLRVADTAERLAKLHGVDPENSRLAALLHDAARELEPQEYLRLAEEWMLPIGDPERENPKLLHGPIAAELARRELGVENEEVLQAVREHTVGAAGMSGVSLVLYLADKIEPHRDYPSVEETRTHSERDLEGAVRESLGHSIAYNERRGKRVHPESSRALRWLEERNL